MEKRLKMNMILWIF